MQCPQCQHENASDARFCNQCGTALAPNCPSCGHENASDAKFCNQCGTPLMTPPRPATDQERGSASYTPPHLAEKIRISRNALEGERKQVTVMFADLKDSTELIRDLDPEAAQQLLDSAIHIMMDAVHRFEGTVNQVLGDGIMAILVRPSRMKTMPPAPVTRRASADTRRLLRHGRKPLWLIHYPHCGPDVTFSPPLAARLPVLPSRA